MNVIIISFYTHTYKEKADRLISDCKTLGLEHYIVELPSVGDWAENTRLKAGFILNTINELKRRVLWIDADSRILGIPVKTEEVETYAAVPTMGRYPIFASGLCFNYCEKSIKFLISWKEGCEDTSGKYGDHDSLGRLWSENPGMLLPKSYCCMTSRQEDTIILNGTTQSNRGKKPRAVKKKTGKPDWSGKKINWTSVKIK